MALINLSPYIDDSFGLALPSSLRRRTHPPRHSNFFVDFLENNTAPSFFNVDRLLDPSFRHDVTSDDKEMRVSIDVPGVKLEDLKVKVHNGIIEVSGARQRGESKKARFSKTFTIDSYHVDVSKLHANLSDGVLVLSIPKKADKAQKPVEVRITNEPHDTSVTKEPEDESMKVTSERKGTAKESKKDTENNGAEPNDS